MVQKLLEFAKLQLGAVLYPGLLHQLIVLLNVFLESKTPSETNACTDLVQVDDIELFASDAVEQTTFIVKEDDFHRLKFLGEFSGGNVSVDVQNLAGLGLGQAGKDRQSTSADGFFQRTFVNPANFSHKAVLFLVQVVCGKNAGGDRSSTGSKFLEGRNEFQVFFEEDAASNVQGFWIYLGCQNR